jgi:hypothetical protein
MTEAEWLAATDAQPVLRFLGGKLSERKLRLLAVACCRRSWHLLTEAELGRAVEVTERYADRQKSAEDLEDAADAARRVRDVTEATHMRLEREYEAAYRRLRADQRPSWPAAEFLVPGTLRVSAASCAANAAASCADSGAQCAEPQQAILAEITCNYAAGAAEYGQWERLADANNADPETWHAVRRTEQFFPVLVLRDLVGNPFRRSPDFEPAWLAWKGGIVREQALAAYEHRELPDGTLDPARLAVLADALADTGCTDAELLGHLRGPGPHVRGCWALDLVLSKS